MGETLEGCLVEGTVGYQESNNNLFHLGVRFALKTPLIDNVK